MYETDKWSLMLRFLGGNLGRFFCGIFIVELTTTAAAHKTTVSMVTNWEAGSIVSKTMIIYRRRVVPDLLTPSGQETEKSREMI